MQHRTRVEHILARLKLNTPDRVETVLALLDEDTPSPFQSLAAKGLKFAAGAGTRQIFEYIGPKLGKGRMDRELRDYIMLPLREVGILVQGWVDPKAGTVVPNYWKPKSPNNVYRIEEEFRELLDTPDDSFEAAVEEWESATEERVTRIVAAEASSLAEREDERLVTITVEIYCRHFLPDYEVVFIDDKDSDRSAPEYLEAIERLKLPLDLSTRWPDIILHAPETKRFWIVDCVETDGEVDAVRKREMTEAFEANGLMIDGFTTAYRTTLRFAQRQRQMDNIASGTYVWIAEVGGAEYLKESLVDAAEIEEA